MDDWPRLNEVRFDNTPELESKAQPRQGCLAWVLVYVWVVTTHYILIRYGVSSPLAVLTGRHWGILLVSAVILAMIWDQLGKRYAWLVEKPYFTVAFATITVALFVMFLN